MKITWTYILFWIFVIIFLVLITIKIFGHSPSEIQVLVTIFAIFFTGMMDLYRRTGRIEGDVKNIRNDMKRMETNVVESFDKMREDIKELK